MRKKAIEITKTWNKDLAAGATLEGRYLKKEVYEGNFGTTEKYVIEDKDGNKWGVFSSATLTRQFNNIPENSYVWIEYKGEETSKNGRPVKVYDVDYDDEA
ncbi:MAG: hypothetical protein J6S67_06735 [Methanobrevibacter sp.]|nr:hypothetical protein [Methanobrevibacter sp.]